MKKYKVSLAIMTPANYEIEVEAKNHKQAIKKAIADLHGDNGSERSGEIVDYDYCLKEIEESFDLRDETGVSVEEIDSNEDDDCEILCFDFKQ
jgi:hypothetical protein